MTAAMITDYISRLDNCLGIEKVSLRTATTGDWFNAHFNKVDGAVITDVGGAGAFITSISGCKIILSCTGTDVVNMIVWGH